MKRLMAGVLVALVVCMFTVSCKMVTVKPSTPDVCIDVAAYPNSLILKQLDDPCKPYKALVTIAKLGVALDNYTYEDLHNKIVNWIGQLRVGESLSAKVVKDVILVELMKTNKKAGIALFVLSDTMLEFSDDVVFGLDDLKVLIKALEGIDIEVGKLMGLM